MPHKRYCYVDESGQDTGGLLFIVTVVVVGNIRDDILHFCLDAERVTGKRNAKWHKSIPSRRLAYMERVLSSPMFKPVIGRGKLAVAIYHHTRDYLDRTVETIAWSIKEDATVALHSDVCDNIVLIDALPPSQARAVSHVLHRNGIAVKKVRGIRRDENDALIRLADAVCGFVRDAIEGKPEAMELYLSATRNGVIRLLVS